MEVDQSCQIWKGSRAVIMQSVFSSRLYVQAESLTPGLAVTAVSVSLLEAEASIGGYSYHVKSVSLSDFLPFQ